MGHLGKKCLFLDCLRSRAFSAKHYFNYHRTEKDPGQRDIEHLISYQYVHWSRSLYTCIGLSVHFRIFYSTAIIAW